MMLQCLSILAHMCMKLTYTTPSAYHQLWALAEKVKVVVIIKMSMMMTILMVGMMMI